MNVMSIHSRDALVTLLFMPWAAVNPVVAAGSDKDPTFYSTWSYAQPSDILPFIRSQAAPGDAQAILDAMDAFSLYYPQYKIGPEKGVLFEGVLQRIKPRWALEVGTFLGYSAIRTARNLQPGGQLLCIEANPMNAAVAREVVQYAGYGKQVHVLDGLSSQVIPGLPQLLATMQQPAAQQLREDALGVQPDGSQPQQQQSSRQQLSLSSSGFDCVFLDHCKECYLPDLQLLEQLGLVRQNSTVIADNVVYPGAPGFLEFLSSSGRYTTELLRARYEYDQAWNPDWEPKEDALSVSVCSGPVL